MKRFGLEFANSVRTPMSLNVKLTVDFLGKNVDSSLYRSMIGSLLYLTGSRPDISVLSQRVSYDCFEKNH